MKKVITYGTYDLFHRGHYNILKRAKEYGDYLIVGVTSESYDIERGKLSVHDSLRTRMDNVLATGFADEVIIEEYLGQKIRDIMNYNVDTLVIGSDWMGKFDHLNKYCEVVYLERTKNISSTQIRQDSENNYTAGIIVDGLSDIGVVSESKYVSGINIEKVYSEDTLLAEKFCDKYEISSFENSMDKFLDGLNIVLVQTDVSRRYDIIKKCLNEHKHVICSAPASLDYDKQKELIELSKENGVALFENITTLYLRAFMQLLWMTQGDVIGNTLSVKCSISAENLAYKNSMLDMTTLAISVIVKLLGVDYESIHQKNINAKDGSTKYITLDFEYKNSFGFIEIGEGIELENQLTIIGDKATIVVKDDWWNTGYFELKHCGERHVKKSSFNFEGTGFRYTLQELLVMLNDKRSECTRLFAYESLAVVKALNSIKLD